MTIDINELRMLAQDFKLAGSPMFLQTTQMNELLDRLEAAEKERNAMRANLERVEKQRDGLIGTMRVLAARPAVDEGRNNWEAIVWESICFAEEAITQASRI